jgi:transcription elongation GreA/GreB family factor
LISNVGELKVKLTELKAKIAEYEIIRIEKVSKSIKVGCVVRLKYVLTGEIITILISEYQSGVIEYQSVFRGIKSWC